MTFKITIETDDLTIFEKIMSIIDKPKVINTFKNDASNINSDSIPDIYFLSVFDLDLDSKLITRIVNCLIGDHIVLLGDLASISEDVLCKIPNLGIKSRYKLRESLTKLGINLQQITATAWNGPHIIEKRIEKMKMLIKHNNFIEHIIEKLR